jgi:transcriptional regulator with XRE-family HTH domain
LAGQGEKNGKIHPLLRKAEEDALRSQLADLRAQLEEYEGLQAGKRAVFQLESLEELPRALIQARIASGLSQKELAEKLELKEQQIQRYEATEYASASLSRLIEVIRALEVKVREDVFLPDAHISFATLFKRLKEVGIDRNLVLARLLPPSITAHLQKRETAQEHGEDTFVLQAAARIGRVFGWTPDVLLGASPLQLNTAAVGATRFKVAARADERRINAYTVYAQYLAALVLDATPHLPRKPIPTEADTFRKAVVSAFGSVTFEHVLRYVWSLGVAVLPLNDPGVFHGACWRVDGRNVSVLKQRTLSAARWLFDLLHETDHAGHAPEQDQFAVIEASETSMERWESLDEQAASRFAGDVMLAGRSEELAEKCVEVAKGSVERLKAAVPRVAKQEHVPVDFLANYMAFRLSLQKINWWGAATNLQAEGPDPWKTARNIFLEQAAFERINELDRTLLMQALSE